MTEDVMELVGQEIDHAYELITHGGPGGWSFDKLADAAETLARAANRVAPEGHGLKVERS